MEEFMFFIRKQGNSNETLPADTHQQFLKSCERYIENLQKEGKLISAQPIEWKGRIVSRADTTWRDVPFNEGGEVIGGYYHILAKDFLEATSIAKANPEFEYNPKTRIEIRPIKTKEETTGFRYPGA
jgi:hypothetical protein